MHVIISEYSEEEHNALHGIEMGVSATVAAAAAAASASSSGAVSVATSSAAIATAALSKKKDASAAAGRDSKGDTKYYRVINAATAKNIPTTHVYPFN